jgi:hypothetical protein
MGRSARSAFTESWISRGMDLHAGHKGRASIAAMKLYRATLHMTEASENIDLSNP